MHRGPSSLLLFVLSLFPLSITKSAQRPASRCGMLATQCSLLRGCGASSWCVSRGRPLPSTSGVVGLGWAGVG